MKTEPSQLKELLDEVKEVIKGELEQTNQTYKSFHSLYEVYAVIKDVYEDAKGTLHDTHYFLKGLWRDIRIVQGCNATNLLSHIKKCAVRCAANTIKIAVMAQKAIDYIEKSDCLEANA